VSVELWNIASLRKVCLVTYVPVNSYPRNALAWAVEVVMGDIRWAPIAIYNSLDKHVDVFFGMADGHQ
jgi:hypothetical protein